MEEIKLTDCPVYRGLYEARENAIAEKADAKVRKFNADIIIHVMKCADCKEVVLTSDA